MGFGSYDEEDQREETVEANDDDQLDRPDDADAEGDVTFENGTVEEQLARFREARGETADESRTPADDGAGTDDGGLVDEVAGRLSDEESAPDRDEAGVAVDDARRPGDDDPFAAAADLGGVGETVVGRLRDRFDADEFAAATTEELTAVEGLGRTKAERIAAETSDEGEAADRGR